MNQNGTLSILQILGGNFPMGGFSQSWGLETYVAMGKVNSEDDFDRFLDNYIKNVLTSLEVPLLCEAYRIFNAEGETMTSKWDKLRELDQLATAVKLTKESREGSHRTGKAFLRIMAPLISCMEAEDYYKKYASTGINFPVLLGAIGNMLKINIEDLTRAFVFNSVNGLIQAGIKLIPLGNFQAQEILFGKHADMEEAAIKGAGTNIDSAFSFCPELDIASMNHENLFTRIYMS